MNILSLECWYKGWKLLDENNFFLLQLLFMLLVCRLTLEFCDVLLNCFQNKIALSLDLIDLSPIIFRKYCVFKEGSQTKFKFYHFNSILSLEISIERWLLGLLDPNALFSGFTANHKPPVSKEKNRFMWLPPPKLFF